MYSYPHATVKISYITLLNFAVPREGAEPKFLNEKLKNPNILQTCSQENRTIYHGIFIILVLVIGS